MIRLYFTTKIITLNTVPYTIGLHNPDQTENYLEYDPDTLYVDAVAGKVYAKVNEVAGAVLIDLPVTAVEDDTVDTFGHCLYHSGAWYLQIG